MPRKGEYKYGDVGDVHEERIPPMSVEELEQSTTPPASDEHFDPRPGSVTFAGERGGGKPLDAKKGKISPMQLVAIGVVALAVIVFLGLQFNGINGKIATLRTDFDAHTHAGYATTAGLAAEKSRIDALTTSTANHVTSSQVEAMLDGHDAGLGDDLVALQESVDALAAEVDGIDTSAGGTGGLAYKLDYNTATSTYVLSVKSSTEQKYVARITFVYSPSIAMPSSITSNRDLVPEVDFAATKLVSLSFYTAAFLAPEGEWASWNISVTGIPAGANAYVEVFPQSGGVTGGGSDI